GRSCLDGEVLVHNVPLRIVAIVVEVKGLVSSKVIVASSRKLGRHIGKRWWGRSASLERRIDTRRPNCNLNVEGLAEVDFVHAEIDYGYVERVWLRKGHDGFF